LTPLVDDLLDVSRITQNRVELQRRSLKLAAVTSQAIETVEPLLQEKLQQLAVISGRRPLHVDGDRERLVQMVVNVLTNAAKYTDPGGRIELQTREDGAEVVIEVSDTGVGISPELLPRVFDLFVQGDQTLDRSLGGLGIGLSSRRLARSTADTARTRAHPNSNVVTPNSFESSIAGSGPVYIRAVSKTASSPNVAASDCAAALAFGMSTKIVSPFGTCAAAAW